MYYIIIIYNRKNYTTKYSRIWEEKKNYWEKNILSKDNGRIFFFFEKLLCDIMHAIDDTKSVRRSAYIEKEKERYIYKEKWKKDWHTWRAGVLWILTTLSSFSISPFHTRIFFKRDTFFFNQNLVTCLQYTKNIKNSSLFTTSAFVKILQLDTKKKENFLSFIKYIKNESIFKQIFTRELIL